MNIAAVTSFTLMCAAAGLAQEAPAIPKRTLLKYTPPKTAGTGIRTDGDGGSRSDGTKLPSLYVLAPDHTALTTQEQPSLFWYQSGPAPKDAPVRFELTLIDPKTPKPLLKVGTPLAGQKDGGAGIHRVQLARQNVTLDPGVEYKWSVTLVPDANNRSQDVIASGTIRRTPPSPELTEALTKATDKASAYAAQGVWYDALSALSDQIDASPKNAPLRAARADLLQQVGLKAAAEFERKK